MYIICMFPPSILPSLSTVDVSSERPLSCIPLPSIGITQSLRCRVREPPYTHSLPKERNVRLSPHFTHASITHNKLSAQLDWHISLFFLSNRCFFARFSKCSCSRKGVLLSVICPFHTIGMSIIRNRMFFSVIYVHFLPLCVFRYLLTIHCFPLFGCLLFAHLHNIFHIRWSIVLKDFLAQVA